MPERSIAHRRWLQAYLALTLALLLVLAALLCVVASHPWLCALIAAMAALSIWGGMRAYRTLAGEGERVSAAYDRAAASRKVLVHVFDSVLDPMLAIDELGCVVAANPAVQGVFGWQPGDLIGRNVSILMGEPYRSEHDAYLHRYRSTGERRAIGRIRKVLGRRRDGSEFPCELSVSEVMTDEGRRFFGVVRDVSEHEAFAARMAAAERLAAVGEVAAGVAHEVNNPINTIINCAQMIKDGDTAPELCDHVIQEGLRIAGFVRELMGAAEDRVEDYIRIDVHEPLRRALALVGVRLRHAGIELRVSEGAELPPVRARARRLQQVFLNLLINAIDALRPLSRTDKRIEVDSRVESDGDMPWVVVTVQDNGPGVPEYDRKRVFQPFFTTKKAGEGTGLGLAVSSGIVHEHGGRIVLQSEHGASARFAVWLPAATT